MFSISYLCVYKQIKTTHTHTYTSLTNTRQHYYMYVYRCAYIPFAITTIVIISIYGNLKCIQFCTTKHLFTCSVCPLTTGSIESTVDEDKKNSPIPSYVNVELDGRSVPMTTNPGYMQVERMTEGPKPLYGNL